MYHIYPGYAQRYTFYGSDKGNIIYFSIFIFQSQKSFVKSLKTTKVALPLTPPRPITRHIAIKYHNLRSLVQKNYLYMLHWYRRTNIGKFYLATQQRIIHLSQKRVIWMANFFLWNERVLKYRHQNKTHNRFKMRWKFVFRNDS